jgi:hypothetical protein
VERIGDQHEPGGGQAVGHREGAHATTHRAPAEQNPLGSNTGSRGKRGRLGANGVDQHRRAVWRLTSGDAIREVDARHWQGRQRPLDRDERRLVTAGTGTRREQQGVAAPRHQ